MSRKIEIARGTAALVYFSVCLVSMLDVHVTGMGDGDREARSGETMSPAVRGRLANEMMRRPPSS